MDKVQDGEFGAMMNVSLVNDVMLTLMAVLVCFDLQRQISLFDVGTSHNHSGL